MRTISAQSITDTVAQLCIKANTQLPQDVQAALEKAREELCALRDDIRSGQSYDICAVRLDAAAALLGEAVGLDSPQALLDRVFSTFCIGK